MPSLRLRMLRWASLTVVVGTGIQFAGCGGVSNYLGNFNPCGTILACNPVQYRFIQSGYEGPGADPEVDPFCTWPGFCSSDVDPLNPYGGSQE